MRIIFKLLILPFVFPCLAVSAQVTTNLNNQIAINDQGKFTKLYRSHIDFKLPAKSADSLLQIEKHEQSVSDNAKPFRLAVPVKVDLDIPKLTQWNYENDSAYGKFTIEADGALSLSINFDEFFLPKGTEMYVYNKNGNMITGPITEIENNVNKIWGSWVYEGELLNIEIKTPILTLSQLLLHSNNIAYGYKEVYDKVVGFGNSGSCEINVVCSLGTGWENERNTVALVLNDDGSAWCSGCMVMNTCSTNKPFFLTADHCLKGQDVSGWRFTFQAWSPTCTPSQNSNGLTFNGSSLKANYSPSDFCLVELNTTPANSSGIYYAGWTRSTTAASNTTGIHHPMGDVMKISRDNAASSKANYLSTTGNTHWLVDWDNGVTEGGSSGSPLFDQNHRIIGQLHGGYSYCGSGDLRDWYGAFDLSWTGGGTNATRLSNWLDPDNTGAMTTNTTDVNSLNIPIGTLSSACSLTL